MSLNFRLAAVLLLVLSAGCGGKVDPYRRQVNRALEATIQGQELRQEGELQRAARAFQRSLQISQRLDDQAGVARELNNLGATALEQGKLAAAREFFSQALVINQESGRTREAAINQANLATVAQKTGEWAAAGAHLHAACRAAELAQDRQLLAQLRVQEAGLALDQGQVAEAAALLGAIPPASLGSDQGSWYYQQGRLALAQGDPSRAWKHFALALAADRQQLRHSAMAADLRGQAEAAAALHDYQAAFAALGRAAQIYLALGQLTPAAACVAQLHQLKQRGGLPQPLTIYEEQLRLLQAEASRPAAETAPPLERQKTNVPND